MNNFTGIICATVLPFNQGTPDKNGLMPSILNVNAGKCPNRIVLSGTIVQSMGVVEGSTYLMQVRETAKSDQYGRQFQFTSLKELGAIEILGAVRELGDAQVFSVDGTTESNPSVEVESETEQVAEV